MPSMNLSNLQKLRNFISKRYVRTPFGPPFPRRTVEDRLRIPLGAHKDKGLKMAEPGDHPGQWKLKPPVEPTVKVADSKQLPLSAELPPYQKYSPEDIKKLNEFETFYDPLFNPHLHEERHRVDPNEEPFNAIYSDSNSGLADEYTKVRNITTPELWDYVMRLEKIKIAPEPKRRKAGDPIEPLPSGYYPPPETPPDLPYFVARTRNHMPPVYYALHSDPEKCQTLVKLVSGDMWKLEEDLRVYLEELKFQSKKRILTSVMEPDAMIAFKGRHIHEIVDWLHKQGF